MRYRWFCLVMVWFCLIATDSALSQSDVPDKHFAPDGRYSVELVPTALHITRLDGTANLIVRAGDKVLSRYLTDDLQIVTDMWSPNGKFVVIAQHTVGGGDRLWLLRLSDGKAIKKPEGFKPVAGQPIYSAQALVRRVRSKFSEYRHDNWAKSGAFCIDGWTPQNELIINAFVEFHNVAGAVDIVDTYHVSARGLRLIHAEMHKDQPVDLQHPLGSS